MKTSVVITSYNKEGFIKKTIESVLQNLSDLEIIIVDDHSTDHSLQEIRTVEDNRIKILLNEENRGANYSRNLGFRKATGDLVIFLDGDDLLAEGAIDHRNEYFEKDSTLDLLVSKMGVIVSGKQTESEFWELDDKTRFFNRFLKHDIPFSIMQPTWRKSFLEKSDLFDEAFERLQDVDFHTHIFKSLKPRVKVADDRLADCYYRIDEERNLASKYSQLVKVVNSSNRYIEKYFDSGDRKSQLLKYTLYRILTQLIYYKKIKAIDRSEFKTLKDDLLRNNLSLFSLRSRFFIQFRIFLNVIGFNFRGVNRIVEKCL